MDLSVNFRSQDGEDRILAEHFKGKSKGVYVEVGAYDGVQFSNTFYFESIGWTGLLVEADPFLAQQCAQNRPNSKVINCAATSPDSAEEVTFEVVMGNRLLSSLSISQERRTSLQNFYGQENQQVTVPARTLDLILEEAGIEAIDFVTIDVERHEFEVLSGFSLAKWRPEILILERLTHLPDRRTMKYLDEHGFVFLRTTKWNDWFVPGNTRALPYKSRLFVTYYLPKWVTVGYYLARKVKPRVRSALKSMGVWETLQKLRRIWRE